MFSGWSEFTSTLKEHAKNVGAQVSQGAKVLATNASQFYEEHKQLLDFDAGLGGDTKQEKGISLWHVNDPSKQQLREQLKKLILEVAQDTAHFERAAPKSFDFDFDTYVPLALVAMKEDVKLQAVHREYVPMTLNEVDFFRRYFYQVHLIREALGVDPLLLCAEKAKLATSTKADPTNATNSTDATSDSKEEADPTRSQALPNAESSRANDSKSTTGAAGKDINPKVPSKLDGDQAGDLSSPSASDSFVNIEYSSGGEKDVLVLGSTAEASDAAHPGELTADDLLELDNLANMLEDVHVDEEDEALVADLDKCLEDLPG